MKQVKWVAPLQVVRRKLISDDPRERREEGLSVMEIVIIALVGLILLAAVLIVYHRFQRDNEVSTGISDLTSSIASIESQFQGQSSYGTSGTSLNSLAMDAKLVPNSMIVDGAIQDPWGGAVGQNPPANNPVAVDGACTTGNNNTITWNVD